MATHYVSPTLVPNPITPASVKPIKNKLASIQVSQFLELQDTSVKNSEQLHQLEILKSGLSWLQNVESIIEKHPSSLLFLNSTNSTIGTDNTNKLKTKKSEMKLKTSSNTIIPSNTNTSKINPMDTSTHTQQRVEKLEKKDRRRREKEIKEEDKEIVKEENIKIEDHSYSLEKEEKKDKKDKKDKKKEKKEKRKRKDEEDDEISSSKKMKSS